MNNPRGECILICNIFLLIEVDKTYRYDAMLLCTVRCFCLWILLNILFYYTKVIKVCWCFVTFGHVSSALLKE